MKPEQLRNSVGVVSPRDFTFEEGLRLQCGQLLAPINLRYETYGRLSPECDNAILIEHALSGDAHVAGYYSETDEKPGWWDTMQNIRHQQILHRLFQRHWRLFRLHGPQFTEPGDR